ncbi:MAG: type transport system permease protein [Pseudonocardiales bacterium]|jgi:ABC-2 type transport system permease protein|nr:type transport system permease protein [Pseudonocardiales bacterium]MDT4919890.1 type transport system permease protein [Pseudonocardiales bacterium]MDT4941570.1 type transport system permease protein [Pseudonocardiales bacterium]
MTGGVPRAPYDRTVTTGIMGRSSGFTSGERFTPLDRARRVWEYRRILLLLVSRDLKVRYAGSALGYVWTVLDPLLMSAVYWFLFTQVIDRHVGRPPYILFLVSGQLAFHWITGSINSSVGALRSEAQMVRSSNVPRELWVLRVVLSKGAEYVFSLPVLAMFAVAYWKAPTKEIFLLPLAFLLTIIFCMGIGLILAPAAVLLKDLRSIVRILVRALFFLSPVLYSIRDVDKKRPGAAEIIGWNPITGIMTLFRSCFYPEELEWRFVAHSAIVSLIILGIGVWVFQRLERPMLKEI